MPLRYGATHSRQAYVATIQICLLGRCRFCLTIYTKPKPHTVRSLSKGLNISKPAISRALDRLSQLGYVRRQRDNYDRRSIQLELTVKGALFLAKFASQVSAAGRELTSPTPFEGGVPYTEDGRY